MTSEQPPEEVTARASIPRRAWGFVRRHPIWIALIVFVVAVRVALPYVLRPVLEDQISALLNGRIEVDNVDLSLLRGEAVVEGVRVYEGENDSVASFDKLLANFHWTALPYQRAVIEEIHLVSPTVRIVREANGEINLARLPAPAEESEEAAEEPEPEAVDEGGGWPAGLTLLALEDAHIVFTDKTVENFEDIEFNAELLLIERVAYGGPIYDGDGKVTLVAEIGGAPLKIEADFASEVLNATSTGNFHLGNLNVGLGSAYAAKLLGWSDLRGSLDIDLDFAAESGEAKSPNIQLALRDFLIAVKGEKEPALEWDALNIAIQMADPQQRFVRVSEVKLTNPVVRVRPADPQPLVLLSKMEPTSPEADDDSPPPAARPVSDEDSKAAASSPAPRSEPTAPAPAGEPAAAEPATDDVDAAPAPVEEPATPAAAMPETAGDAPEPGPKADAAENKPAEPVEAKTESGGETAPVDAAADEQAPVEEREVKTGDNGASAEFTSALAAETPDEVDAEAGEGKARRGTGEARDVAPASGGEGEVAGDKAPRWQLDKLVIEGARVLVEAPEKTLDVGVGIELTSLSSEPGDKAQLAIKTTIEDAALDVAGELGLAPVSFDGAIDLKDLALPGLLPFVPDARAKILRNGVARTDLDVSVLVKEGDAPGVDATVSGTIGLAGLEVADADPKRFSFKWDDLDVAIDKVQIRDGAPGADGGAAPIRIANVALKKPVFRGVRQEDGSIALPAELSGDGAPPSEGEEVESDASESEAPADADGETVAAEAEEATGDATPAIEVDKVRITDGSLRITDRAVHPEAKPGLKTFAVSLDGVRMPERRIEKLEFRGLGLRGGEIVATGKVAGEATDVAITIDKYRLVPYDPYAVTFSGYGIRRGMLSVKSTISLKGDDFDTNTDVIVHQLGLKNTDAGTDFEDQIGVPVNLALALLKDVEGNIKLSLPVSGNSQQTNVSIGGIISQQVKRILVNALTSPLKMFGALGGGDEIGDLSAAQIAFAEGQRALSKKGRKQTEKIAKLLRDRPDLAIHLDVRNSLADVRAMQTGVLLEELRGRENLSEDFAAIRDHLQARADGEESELPYHLEPVLDDMLSHRRPPKEAIDSLAASRIDVVRDIMTGELQVRPEQIIIEEELSDGLVDGPAVIEAELGVVEEDEEEVADEGEESVG